VTGNGHFFVFILTNPIRRPFKLKVFRKIWQRVCQWKLLLTFQDRPVLTVTSLQTNSYLRCLCFEPSRHLKPIRNSATKCRGFRSLTLQIDKLSILMIFGVSRFQRTELQNAADSNDVLVIKTRVLQPQRSLIPVIQRSGICNTILWLRPEIGIPTYTAAPSS